MHELIWIALAFALGGTIKGATGAGAPIIAVPVMAVFYDVQTAVVVFAVPALVSNIWQAWRYRKQAVPASLKWQFVLAAGLGAAIGTWFLAGLSGQFLQLLLAMVVLAYVMFRLAKPDWVLSVSQAQRIAVPAGLTTGVMQGATGISAPVSITFLNAMALERIPFIATISLCFTMMAAVQLPFMGWFGLLTFERFYLGLLALIPLFAFMPIGAFMARKVSKALFDRMILVLLLVLSAKLLSDYIFS